MTIYEPAVTPETEKQWETRRQFRGDLITSISDALLAAEHMVDGGVDDGVEVVTHREWKDILFEALTADLPPVSNHAAEVVTGATILVWAKCPRCHIAGPIALTIEPELRVHDASAELRLRAKAKPRTHVCGQLTIPAGPAEGQESFELEDIVGDASSVDFGEGAPADDDDAPEPEDGTS